MASRTTPAATPAKRANAPKAPAVPTFDTSDNAKVDGSALASARDSMLVGLRAGAAFVEKVGGQANTVAYYMIQASLAITLENGLPDFGGISAAYKQAVTSIQATFYEGLAEATANQLKSRVSSALTIRRDAAIADWTLDNRANMPERAKLSLSGPKPDKDGLVKDLDPISDTPRVILDAPAVLKKEVAKVYDASKLKPKPGRWNRPASETGDRGTQAKLDSAPLNVSEAATEVTAGKVAITAATSSNRELATATLHAALAAVAANKIGAEDRAAGEVDCLACSAIYLAIGKVLAGKWEGDADMQAVTPHLFASSR